MPPTTAPNHIFDYSICALIIIFELIGEALFIDLFRVAYRYALICLICIAGLVNYLTAWMVYEHITSVINSSNKPKVKLTIGYGSNPDVDLCLLPLNNVEDMLSTVDVSTSTDSCA